MEKIKKYSIVIGVVGLILILTGVTYSFFNYTRTGLANNFRVGNIYFNTSQDGNINLTNVFPITKSDLSNDVGNHDSVEITITGSTDYTKGIEYLITVYEVNNTINGKRIPITFNSEVDGIGTSDDDYFDNRGGNSSIYKLYEEGRIRAGEYLLVGYIASGTTGIAGSITLTAFIDADKMVITDTPEENTGWIDNRIVFSTEEWNSLNGNLSLSFKLKVEANEGTWVRDLNEPTEDSCFTSNVDGASYTLNSNITTEEINYCVSKFYGMEWDGALRTGETMQAYCDGTGTLGGRTLQQNLDDGDIYQSDLNDLEEAGVIVPSEYVITITNYDNTCGNRVVIPENMIVTVYDYIFNNDITSEEINTCISYFNAMEWSVNTSNGETMESFCNGTGTMWGYTMQQRIDKDYFDQSAIDYLEENNIILRTSSIINGDVVSIGEGAFQNKNLQSVSLPNGLKNVSKNAFKGNLLDEAIIPNTVQNNVCSIFAFDSNVQISQNGNTFTCSCFATYVENNSVTITGYDNTCTKNVVIPREIDGKLVTSIGYEAFYNKGLLSVQIPNSVTSLDYMAFSSNLLTSVTIPDSVTTIGSNAFSYNRLTSIEIPSGITRIAQEVFRSNQISSIVIPSNIIALDYMAFFDNPLTSVVIGSSVSNISRSALSKNTEDSLSIVIDKPCATIRSMTDYPRWIVDRNRAGTTIYGSNNAVCDSW